MLTYQQYSEYFKFSNKEIYDLLGPYFEKFSDTDKKKNRIYFDLAIRDKTPAYSYNEILEEVIATLKKNDFVITRYVEGLCQKGSSKNEVKIGKVLETLAEKEVLNIYNTSRTGRLLNQNDLAVVICRHPYDTSGISTGRGWTSCLDMESKGFGREHLQKLKMYMLTGGIAAYLIRKNDRNINYPIARIKIYKFWNKPKFTVDWERAGTVIPDFMNFVINWVETINKEITLPVMDKAPILR